VKKACIELNIESFFDHDDIYKQLFQNKCFVVNTKDYSRIACALEAFLSRAFTLKS